MDQTSNNSRFFGLYCMKISLKVLLILNSLISWATWTSSFIVFANDVRLQNMINDLQTMPLQLTTQVHEENCLPFKSLNTNTIWNYTRYQKTKCLENSIFSLLETRLNEFGSMTARKDDTSPIKSIFYNKRLQKGHIRPCKTIWRHIR